MRDSDTGQDALRRRAADARCRARKAGSYIEQKYWFNRARRLQARLVSLGSPTRSRLRSAAAAEKTQKGV